MTHKKIYELTAIFFGVFFAFALFLVANLFIQGPLSNLTPIKIATASQDDTVISRIAPVGKTKIKGEEPEAVATAPSTKATPAAAGKSGDEVYAGTCSGCHGTGVLGAPKKGNKDDWAPRIANGIDALVTSAINGKGMMPPRGGNAALSDSEIKAAIEFMNK